MAPKKLSTFIFVVGGKLMGLNLAEIERVLPAAELLEPPQRSPGLAGFLNDGGQAIAILDLRALLGLPARALRASDRIVLVRAWQQQLGFIVDEALGVQESGPLQSLPPELEALHLGPGLEGVVQMGEKLVVIQNFQKFLTSSLAGVAASLQGGRHPRGSQTP